MDGDPMQRFAAILARRDSKEGGYRHGAWGVQSIVWAANLRKDHAECGKLDLSAFADFKAGYTNALVVICPVHGHLEGPEMPT